MTEYESLERREGDKVLEFLVCPKHGPWLHLEYGPNGSIVRGKHFCEKCAKERMELAAWGRSGIPLRFKSKTFDSYVASTPEQKKALAACRAYSDSFTDRLAAGDSLVLAGAPGTGKTHLACAIGGQLVQSGRSVLFMSMREMVTKVTSTWGGAGSEAAAIKSLVDPDLLIVDEVAGESGSDVEKRVFFTVINARYEALKPVVLITNATSQKLRNYLGERAFSRLCETASIVLFTWASHRGTGFGNKGWAK